MWCLYPSQQILPSTKTLTFTSLTEFLFEMLTTRSFLSTLIQVTLMFRRKPRLLVCPHIGESGLVQGWRGIVGISGPGCNADVRFSGERQEVHAAAGPAETARHRVHLHVAAPHVPALQQRGQERLQRLQDSGPVLREPGRRGLLESLLPEGRRLPGEEQRGHRRSRGRGENQ